MEAGFGRSAQIPLRRLFEIYSRLFEGLEGVGSTVVLERPISRFEFWLASKMKGDNSDGVPLIPGKVVVKAIGVTKPGGLRFHGEPAQSSPAPFRARHAP